ncbi:MAG: DnaJ domain-containing protein [Sandaracinaceae bacterium]
MSDRLDLLDYYTLLQVEDRASADEVRRAFHLFALRYHPDRFASAPPDKRERAAQIYRRGAEAYRVLMNSASRTRYDAGLRRGKLRLHGDAQRQSTRPGSGRLVVRSARARPFATKALDAYRKGDFKAAHLNLKMALVHEPDNALLRARLDDVEARLRAG